jgi:LPS export ABC transporter protein LptC
VRTTANNKPSGAGRKVLLPTAFLFLLSLLAACDGDKKMIPEDRRDSADQEVCGAHVRRSEYGKLQLELDSPLIQKFEKPIAKTIYKSANGERVQLRLYDDDRSIKSSIEANYAISYDDRDIMEAHDSVVVIDYSNGDTIYLEDLIWNSSEDRIYSEHPVRAKNGNRITEGDGFVSDQRMENMQIIRQRGIIEFEE